MAHAFAPLLGADDGVRVQGEGFVSNMPEWMEAADCLVTKAGVRRAPPEPSNLATLAAQKPAAPAAAWRRRRLRLTSRAPAPPRASAGHHR